MPAYVIVLREGPVEDPAAYDEYLRVLSENALDPRMSLRSFYGAVASLEGEPAKGVVLLEFPTVDDARDWYYGDAYQAAAPHRIKSARYRAMIVEGVP